MAFKSELVHDVCHVIDDMYLVISLMMYWGKSS